jgi:uncharacterized membrane protein YhhN
MEAEARAVEARAVETRAIEARGMLMSGYVLVGVLNVIAVLTDNANGILLTKPLLMPLLFAWLVVVAWRDPAVPLRWIGIGIVFAWIGDLALLGESDTAFLAGVAAFLVMQVCYLVAFLRVPGPGLVRAWKVALIPYIGIWIAINALVWGGTGNLRIPVLVYSAVAVAMAAAALDLVLRLPQALAWRVAAGGALFVLSDALIALTAFGPLTESARASSWVMATYVAAQGLIVTGFAHGVLRRDARR